MDRSELVTLPAVSGFKRLKRGRKGYDRCKRGSSTAADKPKDEHAGPLAPFVQSRLATVVFGL